MKKLITICLTVVLLAGCGQNISVTDDNEETSELVDTLPMASPTRAVATTSFSSESEDTEKITTDLISGDMVASNYRLGMDILKSFWRDEPESNLLVSPLSLSIALAMLQNGAEGETKEQINGLLGEDMNLNEAYKQIILYLLQGNSEEQELLIADSYWMRNDMTPKQNFIDTLESYYDAEVFISDFSNPETVDAMNAWVEEKTNDLLKDTIEKLEADTLSILMNTIYFKGTWVDEFDSNFTNEQDFYVSEAVTETVEMMHKNSNFNYYEDGQWQSIIMPYLGGTEMVVMLPKEDLTTYIENMTEEDLLNIVSSENHESVKVDLSFPKFTYEAKNELNDILMELGMIDAFSKDDAEFTNMIEENVPVWVSKVFQNTSIDLDEAGTEAAAVTVIEMVFGTSMPTEQPKVMICDKPFMYVIQDSATKLPLFMGLYSGE